MRSVFLLLLMLLLICNCNAQSTELNELHFNRLSIKNGLPEEAITATLQDREGYMWVGTQGGLVRYDGYSPKVYQFGFDDPNHADITCIYEDRSGELWIGTRIEGLYHYNRAADSFVQYKHKVEDNNSIGEGSIPSIHDDRNGNLWVIASGVDGNKNLNVFDTKKHQFKHFGNLGKGNHYINASDYDNLFEDSKGGLWVGSNNGFYEYDFSSDKFIPHFALADAEQHKGYNWLTEDAAHSGIIWMNVWNIKLNKGEGLLRYNMIDHTVKRYQHIPNDSTSLGNDNIYAIQRDSHGRIWIGADNDLSLFDPALEQFTNYQEINKQTNPFERKIWSLTEDKAGNFWCVSATYSESNLLFFDSQSRTFKAYKSNGKGLDALSANNIRSLLIDRSGTLWVGTAFEGLYWLNNNRSKFTVYKNDPGQLHYFPGRSNTSFAEDKDGTFWVWSSHGLYHWHPVSDSFTFIKGMNDQGYYFFWHFSSIVLDKNGVVWCSSYGKGLFSYNPKTNKIKNFKNDLKDSSSISSDGISWLYEDRKGTLWVATMGNGICSFDGQNNAFKRYPYIHNTLYTPNNNALDDAVVYKIFEDEQGALWVGTNLGGLNRYNNVTGTFTSYQNQSPAFITVTSIFEDSKKQLWAGTHQGGLFLFDRKTNSAKRISEKDGLLSNEVIDINEDNSGNLWITSPRGISILNIQTNRISHLGTTNGLPEDLENNSNLFKTSTGHFLMPSNNGFISFDPDQLKADTSLPVVHIESLEFSKPQAQGNKQTGSLIYVYGKNSVNLSYNENRVTFNYVGLQYQNSQLNQYAYKLDGYDNDWVKAGTDRKVTYTNLSPGTYLFCVKAANSDGIWNEQWQTLTVVISPPWWFTWWAYTSYFLLGVAAIYLLYRMRIKQFEQKQATQIKAMVATQEEERKRISRDLHDDVGTKLSALKLFLSSLNEKAIGTNNKDIGSLAESSAQFITEVMQDVRKMLLNLSPAVLHEFGYATAVEGLVNKINETKQIHFTLVVFGMNQRLQKEYELALYRITQELINNVLKHAEARHVSLQIGKRDDKIILMIEDDGKGFDITVHKDGYGLHNLEARTKLMRGTMTIDSQPGKGTSVLIEIPDNFN